MAGTILFPQTRNKDNAILSKYLLEEWRTETQEGKPPEPLKDGIVELAEQAASNKWIILECTDPELAHLVANWMALAHICTHEQKVIVATYNAIVQSIRRETEMLDVYTRAPYMIVLFPETVKGADWAQGRFLDLILKKPRLVVVTTDVDEMSLSVGTVVSKLLFKKGQRCQWV